MNQYFYDEKDENREKQNNHHPPLCEVVLLNTRLGEEEISKSW
jgi:hypothetical protein